MDCTTCYVDYCITAPANCATGAPGGWQRLWFLNRCDVQQFVYETINGQPRARVTGLSLKPGAGLKTFAYYKRTGLQFDSAAVDENGFRWEHTALVPLVNRDAETMATLRSMVGAELVLIGLHRDGRYWIAGLGEEGFSLTNWADTKGRQVGDGAVMEVTFALTDVFPQTELLLLDGLVSPTDLEARAALTASTLASLVACAGSEVVPYTLSLVDGGGTMVLFSEGIAASKTGKVNITGTCPGPYTITVVDTTLPTGITHNLPLIMSGSEVNVEFTADTTPPVGVYTLSIQATAPGCATSNVAVFTVTVA